jgi:hypothetical protein
MDCRNQDTPQPLLNLDGEGNHCDASEDGRMKNKRSKHVHGKKRKQERTSRKVDDVETKLGRKKGREFRDKMKSRSRDEQETEFENVIRRENGR